MKKVCTSRLLGGQTLNILLPVRSEEIKRFLISIRKRAESNESVDVGKELKKLTNNIISRMMVSKRCAHNDDEADEITEVVNDSAELVGRFNISDFIWFCKNLDLQGLRRKAKYIHEMFDQVVEKIIKEHQELRKGDGNASKDLLDILLEISEDESSEFRLTAEHIKAFFMV